MTNDDLDFMIAAGEVRVGLDNAIFELTKKRDSLANIMDASWTCDETTYIRSVLPVYRRLVERVYPVRWWDHPLNKPNLSDS